MAPFQIEPVEGSLPPEVVAFLDHANVVIDRYFDAKRYARRIGFFPSDYELVYRGLLALAGDARGGRQLCEWGSGFGVVAGLAAFCGFEACGIEIDSELVVASRKLLARRHLDVRIMQGNFVPREYTGVERVDDLDSTTFFHGAGGHEVDVDPDDFDVIFAFPWPTEEEQFCDMFARYAEDQAVLMTYSSADGLRAYRKG
ncbi:MAG: hypothetical protein AAF628_22620 [Planctomycetota bacterium]